MVKIRVLQIQPLMRQRLRLKSIEKSRTIPSLLCLCEQISLVLCACRHQDGRLVFVRQKKRHGGDVLVFFQTFVTSERVEYTRQRCDLRYQLFFPSHLGGLLLNKPNNERGEKMLAKGIIWQLTFYCLLCSCAQNLHSMNIAPN